MTVIENFDKIYAFNSIFERVRQTFTLRYNSRSWRDNDKVSEPQIFLIICYGDIGGANVYWDCVKINSI